MSLTGQGRSIWFVCSFACFDFLNVPVNNLSVLSGWVYLGGSSTKQRIKCLFALIFFIKVNHFESDRTISCPSVLYQFRCLVLGHNTVTLTSVSRKLANLQLSNCAPHRHERLRQPLSIVNFILLDKQKETCRQQLCLDSQKKHVSFRRFF